MRIFNNLEGCQIYASKFVSKILNILESLHGIHGCKVTLTHISSHICYIIFLSPDQSTPYKHKITMKIAPDNANGQI